MDIRHLRYFVGVADSGSLMKASERLHIAQPSLSVHLNNLEIELGVKLMQRSNRGVELTAEGQVLYDRATSLLRQYRETVESVKNLRARPSGTVSLGLPSSCSFILGAELYRRVRSELPDVTLYIADASTAMLYEWLVDGRVDFSILFSLPDDANLDCIPLQVEEFCLISRPDRTDESETIDFDRIFDRPLVVSCQSTTWRKILDDVAARHGKQFATPIETESISALKAIALAGEASGLVPLSSVRAEVERGLLRAQRLINPDIRGMLALVSLRSTQLNPTRRAIRDLVTEVVRNSNAWSADGNTPNSVTPILRTVPSAVLPSPTLKRA
jgi:LysR family transcriptional regulator, nitrogen assimilation regulatory protein